jgi:hypothetical protein
VNAPIGSAFVTDRYFDPTTRLAWAIAISDRVDVSGTIDLKAVRDDDDHLHAKPAASAAVSSTLTGALNGLVVSSPNLRRYLEAQSRCRSRRAWSCRFADRNQIDVWVSHRFPGDPVTGSSAPASSVVFVSGVDEGVGTSFCDPPYNPRVALTSRHPPWAL